MYTQEVIRGIGDSLGEKKFPRVKCFVVEEEPMITG